MSDMERMDDGRASAFDEYVEALVKVIGHR
ncbi:hypothetical protein Q644_06615 [Brucella intermedia 229E]|uniref:Uncharacterized protein n=1 Tax=Brucella intermedia 229E TaxID=1337887 RepID=U4V685_9HYPH|nr:hypothetical protein Q644_06615 [Brucella intermedia 229E]